jgi:hypothetical protein
MDFYTSDPCKASPPHVSGNTPTSPVDWPQEIVCPQRDSNFRPHRTTTKNNTFTTWANPLGLIVLLIYQSCNRGCLPRWLGVTRGKAENEIDLPLYSISPFTSYWPVEGQNCYTINSLTSPPPPNLRTIAWILKVGLGGRITLPLSPLFSIQSKDGNSPSFTLLSPKPLHPIRP